MNGEPNIINRESQSRNFDKKYRPEWSSRSKNYQYED